MSGAEEWAKRVEEFIGEIAADDNLSDEEYLEVMDDLANRAETCATAKREELE